MDIRNERILSDIKYGRNPILDYELELLKSLFKEYITKQQILSRQLKEAMDQSSETWHDNAPAEVIIKESKILSKTAEDLATFLANTTVYDSEIHLQEATLGSYCKIQYVDDDEVIWVHIVGSSLAYSDRISKDSSEEININIASIHSPLAKALIGKCADENKVLFVNNIEVKILLIENKIDHQ